MQAHQQRVIQEEADLSDKIDRLIVFTKQSVFESLPQSEQNLLREQLDYMTQYHDVLKRRVQIFLRCTA
jgi:hypothetical protein